jgi:general secretion pathway protein B
MSYILDALRRADAERERERGAVPGLHSMPVGGAASASKDRPQRWLWLAAGLLACAGLALLAGAWFWPAAEVQPSVSAAQAVTAPEPSPADPGPAGAAVSAAPAAMASAASADAPVPRPLASPPRPPRQPSSSSAATPKASAASPRASAAAPQRGEDKVLAFEQLPDDVKRAIPPLAVGGAIYSDNPASRLLMIGGQLLKEGDSAGSGVTLEQIRPRSAVLRWKDQRYEVRY